MFSGNCLTHRTGMAVVLVLVMAWGMVPAQASEGDIFAANRPEISMVSEGTDQGGTLIVFGENLSSEARVWLWQPVVDGRSIQDSQDELARLRAVVKDFPSVPTMPKEPHPDAVLGRVLGDTGSSQVVMVQQTGGLSWADGSPAWSENTVPTILWVQTEAGTSKPYRVNAPRLWDI